jgi:hypothetical protein
MLATPEEYRLLRNQSALLATALRLISRDGYTFWQLQETPTEKILLAVKRLDEKWAILLDRHARLHRRTARLPVVHALLAPVSVQPPTAPHPTWPILVLSDRPLPNERMCKVKRDDNDNADNASKTKKTKRGDVPECPLTWVAWRKGAWRPTYVLLQDKRGRLTWSLTKEFFQELLEEALHYAHRGDWTRLVGHLKTIGGLPGFAGVWSQMQEIRKRVQKAWGDKNLRYPDGQFKAPAWKAALAGWPRTPLSPIGMPLYPDEPPRTLGEWWEMYKGGT